MYVKLLYIVLVCLRQPQVRFSMSARVWGWFFSPPASAQTSTLKSNDMQPELLMCPEISPHQKLCSYLHSYTSTNFHFLGINKNKWLWRQQMYDTGMCHYRFHAPTLTWGKISRPALLMKPERKAEVRKKWWKEGNEKKGRGERGIGRKWEQPCCCDVWWNVELMRSWWSPSSPAAADVPPPSRPSLPRLPASWQSIRAPRRDITAAGQKSHFYPRAFKWLCAPHSWLLCFREN